MANLQGKGEPFEGIRDVKISNPFYLGKTEVTQELWNSYMKENHSRFIGNSLPVRSLDYFTNNISKQSSYITFFEAIVLIHICIHNTS